MKMLSIKILQNKTNSSLVRYCGNSSRTTYIVATEKFFRIFVSNGLVGHCKSIVRVNATREIQVYIRYFVAMEAQENCERNVVSVTHHISSTVRTSFGRQVKTGVYFTI